MLAPSMGVCGPVPLRELLRATAHRDCVVVLVPVPEACRAIDTRGLALHERADERILDLG